jgi:predicted O-methyltransferase YrrM
MDSRAGLEPSNVLASEQISIEIDKALDFECAIREIHGETALPDRGGRALNWAAGVSLRIVDMFRSVADTLENAVESVRDNRLRRRLANAPDAKFSDDYTTSHETVWKTCLERFIAEPDTHLLEVGVFEGRSTVWFLQNVLTHPTSSVTCIDSFGRSGGEASFDHNIAVTSYAPRVTKLKGLSVDVLPTLGGRAFDIVYVDGSHRAVDVLMDAVLCWELLKAGGVMIFDDYLWESARAPSRRPQMAIDLFLKVVGDAARVLHKEYQVVVLRSY